MAALLALAAAAAYGAGDFLGGVASRREPATAVVLWAHVVGLALMLVTAPLVGGDLTAEALVVGGGAGLVGAIAVALFYQALATGAMTVAAPVTGLLSAAVPVIAGVGGGERPGVIGLVGIGLALPGIVLVSRERAEHRAATAARWRAFVLALGAGLGFGLFFVLLDGVGDDTGIWPLVGARMASVALFALLGVTGVTAASLPRSAGAAAVGAGLLDAGANVFYLLALSHGLLSVVSVLTALYPAGTVLLAQVVLRERMTRTQQTGLAVAGVAAALIAI